MNKREQICKEFYSHPLMKELNSKQLPNIGGSLSTTFSPIVFGQVHAPFDVTVMGANTAIRPTDFDGCTHLPCFSQLYIATNQNLSDRQEAYVSQILNDIVKAVSFLPIEELKVVSTEYTWHADSTGYSGGGYQMDVREAVIDGKTYDIGHLEIVQLNDYNQSGTIKGRSSHLIVFGIDRIINLIRICEALYEGRSIDFNDTAYLYDLSNAQVAWQEDFISRLVNASENTNEVLRSISNDFKQRSNQEDYEEFAKLGRVNTLMECAYAANIITSGHRNYFIREARKLYKSWAKYILENPRAFKAYIESQTKKASGDGQVWTPEPTKDAFMFAPEILEFFPKKSTVKHGALNRKKEKIPNNLLDVYLLREFGKLGQINMKSPAVINKITQFENIFDIDFTVEYEKRKTQFPLIHTRIGTLQDRKEAIVAVLKQLSYYSEKQFNIKKSFSLICYYLTEFTYRAHKLHPFLKGHCVPIQLEHDGIADEQTCINITALHYIGKLSNRINNINDNNMLAAIGAIYLTEASLYYAVSEKNPSTKDPDGVKSKLDIALFALKNLGLDVSTIEELVDFIIEGSDFSKPSKYLKKRIQSYKGLSSKEKDNAALEKKAA